MRQLLWEDYRKCLFFFCQFFQLFYRLLLLFFRCVRDFYVFSTFLCNLQMYKHRSLRSLLVKFIKTGAKIVRHSRYVTFQMAEIAIDKRLFAKVLTRIEQLRCCAGWQSSFGFKQGIAVSKWWFSERSISCIPTYSTLSKEKTLFQLYEYHKLNLLNEKFKVISPHEFDMGNTG